MKLATLGTPPFLVEGTWVTGLTNEHRDGCLAVISKDLTKVKIVPEIAPTLQDALDNWSTTEPKLQEVYIALNDNSNYYEYQHIPFNMQDVLAPLPRAYQWLDGSAYLSHVARVRKARGAEVPDNLYTDPLMYQGASDVCLGGNVPIHVGDEEWGIDFEGEVGIITDEVPYGIATEDASNHIKLIVLINDVSLRNLIPNELAKGFGFIQGKPPCAFSPVAITPDELGTAWQDTKVHLPLYVHWNHALYGQANAGVDKQFSFAQLISHAARTRKLSSGTIIGSGTISNHDATRGFSCIVEKRVVEIAESGSASTEYMKYGDVVKMEMIDANGKSIFGAIEQVIKPILN